MRFHRSQVEDTSGYDARYISNTQVDCDQVARVTVLTMTTLRIGTLFVIGFVRTTSAYVNSANRQHHSASSYSSSSSHESGHAYSYKSQSAHSPGYSYSYSYSDSDSPLFFPGYATGFHSYTPLSLSSIDFPIDFDLDDDLDPDLDFDIDTDLDLDLDLDFPGIGYGLGYVGKYGHWLRKPKYGFSKLYSNINGDFWNYGGRYGYDHLGPSHFGSFDFFK